MSQTSEIVLYGPDNVFICCAYDRFGGYTYPLTEATIHAAKAIESLLRTDLGAPITRFNLTHTLPPETYTALCYLAFGLPEGSPNFCSDPKAYEAAEEPIASTSIHVRSDGTIYIHLGGCVLAPTLAEELDNQGYNTLNELLDDSSDVYKLTNHIEVALVREVVDVGLVNTTVNHGLFVDTTGGYGFTIHQAEAFLDILDKYHATDGGTVLVPFGPGFEGDDDPVLVTM